MRFALIGVDHDSLRLAEAIGASWEHALVAIFDPGKRGAEAAAIVPRARLSDDWESLLHAAQVDAVIVTAGADRERRADQLRKLVQAELPIVLIHPGCESIIGYELDMVRRDSMTPIVPYVAWQYHPAWAALTAACSGIGKLTQITVESPTADNSRGAITAALARDFHRLAPIMGEVTQIGAIGAASTEAPAGPLSVHMTTASGIVVRWVASPRADLRIECLGSAGRAELTAPYASAGWRLSVTREGKTETIDFPHHDEATAAIDGITARLLVRDNGVAALAAWRATELAETALDSLERGRTIEMQPVEHSEEKTFKGLMAMGGCAILILAMAGCLIGALFDALKWKLPAIGGRWWWLPGFVRDYWLLWLAVAIVLVFLLLQSLAFLFAARTPKEEASAKDPKTGQPPPG